MKTAPLLITDRLVLRGIDENDSSIIVRLRSNPDVYKYFFSPHKITIEEHVKWFRESYLRDSNRCDWIALKSGNVIGVFSVKRISVDEAEISYLLDPKYTGNGYACEAVSKLFQFCADTWNTKIIAANIHKDNTASRKFIERLGFLLRSSELDFICYERRLN